MEGDAGAMDERRAHELIDIKLGKIPTVMIVHFVDATFCRDLNIVNIMLSKFIAVITCNRVSVN